MILNPNVWGPHYWFVMHTIAMGYPKTPNETCRRKYYDLISNMPLFIPNAEIGNKFADLLDKYPVTPYLDSQESFIRWVHFIHNKINSILGKPEIGYLESLDIYGNHYKPKPVYLSDKLRIQKKYIYIIIVFMCLLGIYIYS